MPTSASSSVRLSACPPRSRLRTVRAAPAIAAALIGSGRDRTQSARRASRVASANGQKSSRDTRWIVTRISVACTTVRATSASVTACRSRPSSRLHSPMYIDGAYCAWIPPTASSARGSGIRPRSSSSWRASSARLSSRRVRVRTRPVWRTSRSVRGIDAGPPESEVRDANPTEGDMTTTAPLSTLTDDAVETLRAQLRGSVIRATDPEYASVREVFNAMHDARPEIAVRCEGTADVVAAVKFARAEGLAVAVRGGGHSIAGLSAAEGGMLIDLEPMSGVQVDPERKLARVQGGAVLADLDRETQAFGLVSPTGVVSDTGVAGLTLGGGYGWLRRKYGLASDSLVEAQVVCADGIVRTASDDVNPDLFWAIRGGGGNFGVVTSFTFRLYELGPDVAFSATFYPLEEIAQVMRGWRDYVEGAPDEVTSTCVTITFPANPALPEAIHDRPVVIVGGVYAGDIEEGMAATAPLRSLGTPLFDMSGPTPFIGVQSGFDALFPRNTLRAYWKSQYLDELSDEAIDVVAAKALDRPAPLIAGQHVPHGRRDRRRRPRGDRVRDAPAGLHGVDRRHVDRRGHRRRGRGVGAVGLGGDLPPRDRRRLPQLHRPVGGGGERRRGQRLRAQPAAAGRGEGDLRPGQLLPDQQQHRSGRPAVAPARCAPVVANFTGSPHPARARRPTSCPGPPFRTAPHILLGVRGRALSRPTPAAPFPRARRLVVLRSTR